MLLFHGKGFEFSVLYYICFEFFIIQPVSKKVGMQTGNAPKRAVADGGGASNNNKEVENERHLHEPSLRQILIDHDNR